MKLTGETKLFLGIFAVTALIISIATLLLSRPSPTYTRDVMIPKGAQTKGNPDAKVYLVEFSDFQCPACKAAKPYVDGVLEKYGDRILFGYRHFPLDSHPFGQKAAEVAEIAAIQGKFWQMYDLLFINQEKFADSLFLELAKQVQLDEKQFVEALTSGTYREKVLLDKADGLRFGVAGTPSFFLNGTKLELTSFAELEAKVAQALNE